MSMDADGQQRRWLALGYGGKTSSPETWRYWKTADRRWTIVAPHGLAEFEQRHRSIFYRGEEVLTAATQWEAIWRAVAYFYSHVVSTLPAPPMN
ncbi:hypothetical protein M2282_006090 [Variovorax boronicumulans]|uniref:hypothetical protein n=1 Tax=Variovorax boronicumulans TaxID=436515 RepID=UPI002475DD3E|nr:hypothetical protein [Variovorax boronicumulans]MDH6170910.1 hypothetical protein [Variovorax boronicumulans]